MILIRLKGVQMGSAPQGSDIYQHVLGRLTSFTSYTSKRMDINYREMYVLSMKNLQFLLLDRARNATTVFEMMTSLQNALDSLPLQRYRKAERLLGKSKIDKRGCKLAIEGVVDLILSYRRFQGFTENEAQLYYRWGRHITSSYLEKWL